MKTKITFLFTFFLLISIIDYSLNCECDSKVLPCGTHHTHDVVRAAEDYTPAYNSQVPCPMDNIRKYCPPNYFCGMWAEASENTCKFYCVNPKALCDSKNNFLKLLKLGPRKNSNNVFVDFGDYKCLPNYSYPHYTKDLS